MTRNVRKDQFMHLYSVYDCNYSEGRTDSESLIPMPDTPFHDASLISPPRATLTSRQYTQRNGLRQTC